MISEGSCDAEYWSNDAENSALHHRNTFYFKRYSNRKQLFWIVTIFHYNYIDKKNSAFQANIQSLS